MRSGNPDTSLLSRLLRGRITSGRHPLTGKPGAATGTPAEPADAQQRSSAVIGALMRDAREAYDRVPAHPAATTPAPVKAGIQTRQEIEAQLNTKAADPCDLSALVLETLNQCEWEDWVSARCDFPATGPFVISGSTQALDAIADLIEQVFADAGEDGDDLTVHVFTGSEGGSARITVTGPFSLSMQTLTMIKKYRRHVEGISGALYTVRTLSSSGFEALIPER
jgi:hypothetical protein